jgi:5-hydroxyisourate hydrolase
VSISTHVLDISAGRPASGVGVRLQFRYGGAWIEVSADATNDDGRVPALVPADAPPTAGTYRLTFEAGSYFQRLGVETFYGEISIEFIVRDAAAHHHVPLLLSPFGYSTYRGS